MIQAMLLLLVPFFIYASSPFETQKGRIFDTSIFDTKKSADNEKAMNNEKIKCRTVCDKKLYKEQKIAEAVSFYKTK